MYKALDPLLHSQLRLAVISHLVGGGQSDFKSLQKVTLASAGNLSVQLKKLEKAEYIRIEKSFLDNYPHTVVYITPVGIKAFETYVAAIKGYIQ